MLRLNNKGFTLVEVMMVVAILAIITMIMVPTVTTMMDQGKQNSFVSLRDSIRSAAKIYVANHRYDLGISCTDNVTQVTLNELVEDGSLSSPIVDPRNKKDINGDTNYVVITYDCATKQFTYVVKGDVDWPVNEEKESK